MVSPAIQTYFSKMKGQRHDPKKLKAPPKQPTRIQVLVSSFVGSFVGIAIVASLTYNAQWFIDRNTPVMAGSFGASAVLIYGAIEAPLSQPRNVTSASALIAVSGGQVIYDLGYWYLLCPIALGVAFMMAVAMLVNNVVRTYPSHWWAPKTRMIAVVDQDMSTTLADFMPPGDDDEDEDEVPENKQGDLTTAATNTSTAGNNKSSLNHQSTISSSSSMTFSPTKETATTTLAADSHSTDQPHSSITPSSPRPVPSTHPHSHSHGQYAVYYGGDHKEELKDGEMLLERHAHSSSPVKDLEHGSSHPHGAATNRRHSILIGLRGSPHPSHPITPSDATHSHVAVAAGTEEEYRATIEQLHQRIQELESRLASSVTTPPAAASSTFN
ncbi:hypothetical protein BGW39_006333 [Mortierella sp. 14UC]|nr:hypothetical protein BGW39_006333 [Mortierella sp. 14UC]